MNTVRLLGAIQIIGGIAVFMESKSAIHEILGAVSFGLGSVCIALSVVIGQLADMKQMHTAKDT